ncbi:MAG: hypothetical protein ILA25_02815 [Prevotella sp.]|nr:hypothetical protein [Prevotella sp.]
MAGNDEIAGASITWSTDKPEILSVDQGGILTVAEEDAQGEVNVKAEYAGNETYKPSSKTYKFSLHKYYLMLSDLVPSRATKRYLIKEAS